MIVLTLSAFIFLGIVLWVTGIIAAIGILWLIVKWGLIIGGVYLLCKELFNLFR